MEKDRFMLFLEGLKNEGVLPWQVTKELRSHPIGNADWFRIGIIMGTWSKAICEYVVPAELETLMPEPKPETDGKD